MQDCSELKVGMSQTFDLETLLDENSALKIEDGKGGSHGATIRIDVSAVNDAPVAQDGSLQPEPLAPSPWPLAPSP